MSELTHDDLIKTQKLVADNTLKSEKGWEILRQMYVQSCRQFMATQSFTVPVLNRIDELKERLNDPVGFQKSFHTLLHDLSYFKQQLESTYAKHANKQGKPLEADWPVLFSISLDYSNLMEHYDTVINPLMMSLIDIIKDEHGDMIDNGTI